MPTRRIISSTLNVNTVEDAIDVSLSPESVILVQNESDGTISLANAYTTVSVNKGGIPVNGFTVSILGVENCQASVNNTTKRIQLTQISTHDDIPYDDGYVSVRVTYEGQTYDRRFVFYVNLLGTWKESVVGDTKTEVARSLSYAYTQDGQGVQTLENLGSYIKSSTENISRLEKKSVSNNLILNGAFISSNLNWDNWGNPLTREIVRVGDKLWMHIVSTNAQFEGYQQRHYADYGITVEPGGQYTISLRAHTASGSGVVAIGFHWYNGGTIIPDGGDVLQSWYTFNIDASDKVYSQTFSVPSVANSFNIFVGDNTVNAQNFYITEVKLEKGDIATVWTDNVNDSYSEIKQTADEISLTVHGEMAGSNINLLYGVDGYTASNKLVHKSSATDGVIEYEGNGTPHIFTPVQLIKGCTYTIQCVTDGNIASSHSSSGNPSARLCTIWLRMNAALNGDYNGEVFTYSREGYQNLGGGRHKWTFVCQKTGEYWFRTNSYSDGTTEVIINFWNIKLEGGDTATDWSTSASQMTQGLQRTGIDITKGLIELIANKTLFKTSDGTPMIAVQMCDSEGNVGTDPQRHNIPSLVFYNGEIGNGGSVQFVLNYLGLLDMLSNGHRYSFDEFLETYSFESLPDEKINHSGQSIDYTVDFYEVILRHWTDKPIVEVLYNFNASYTVDNEGEKHYLPNEDSQYYMYYENAGSLRYWLTKAVDRTTVPDGTDNRTASGYYYIESSDKPGINFPSESELFPAPVNNTTNRAGETPYTPSDEPQIFHPDEYIFKTFSLVRFESSNGASSIKDDIRGIRTVFENAFVICYVIHEYSYGKWQLIKYSGAALGGELNPESVVWKDTLTIQDIIDKYSE